MSTPRIDFTKIFGQLTEVARTCESPRVGWLAMCAIGATVLGDDVIAAISTCDLGAESQRVRDEVRALLQREPPPQGIDTLLFGLFDEAESSAGYYVTGVSGFDPEDDASLCDPAWWPNGRYLQSNVLDAVFSAATEETDDSHTMLDYALRFGAAAIISRFAVEGLPYRVVVAFDEGDFAEVAPPPAAT